jgi:hypothetical protein
MSNTLKLGNGKWATGKDTLLSFSDTNNNYKPLPFSFSRDSSGTVINKDGLIETVGSGEPRIDFKDNTKGSLLLEPQRSNVLPYSEDFSQWGLDGGTQSVTPNYAVSPDGTQNAYRLQLDKTGVSYSRMYLDAGTIGEKTSSIWIKSNNNSTQNVGLRYDGVGVNLEITSVWKRFELTATSITVSRFQVILFDSIAGNDESCDIQIYGAQLEQGSYATSYIPTNGSAVTRVEDVCNNGANEQVINSTEGVLYVEISTKDTSIVPAISISDGTAANSIEFAFYGTNQWNYIHRSSAGTTAYASTVTDASEINKFALVWTNSVMKSFLNGVKLDERAVAGVLSGLDDLSFTIFNGALNYFGNVKDVRVYNTVLTDLELIALTS